MLRKNTIKLIQIKRRITYILEQNIRVGKIHENFWEWALDFEPQIQGHGSGEKIIA